RQVLDDVLSEFVHPEGGFYSTLDADSEGEEGKYYVWTSEEVIGALGPEDGAFFNQLYGITPHGNFEAKSIPNLLPWSLPEWAEKLGMPGEDLLARVDDLRARLLKVRSGRVPPGLDDKVLTAWNGLMIRALARGYEVLVDGRYLEAARGAAEFVLARLRRDGRLLVTFRDGQAKLNAYLDDYAFMAGGLRQLHARTGEPRWREGAAGPVGVAGGGGEPGPHAGRTVLGRGGRRLLLHFARPRVTDCTGERGPGQRHPFRQRHGRPGAGSPGPADRQPALPGPRRGDDP